MKQWYLRGYTVIMKMKYVWGALVVAIGAGVLWFFVFQNQASPSSITSYEECAAAGYPVAESYPRQCSDNEGNHFVEDIIANWEISYANASDDLIRYVSVKAGDFIDSPLTITGEARGYWFFEASFPVTIVDWDGRIIAQHYATAVLDPNDPESTWMTEDFVPFTTTVEFITPEGWGGPVNRGAIILNRDNPSGLPENDAALEIPVRFR
jgi:hypothetical protein